VHAALSDIPGIVNYQLIQEPDYQIRILLVADATFPRDAPERLKARLAERLGPGCPISIEFCEGIAPSASGKHRYIISHMQTDRG
jgi:phenylacetate-CoA ligase